MSNHTSDLRKALEAVHGKVFDEIELLQAFQVTAWIIPGKVVAVRRADGVVGSLTAEKGFYFGFQPAPECDS